MARTLIAQKKKERALLALKKKKLSENQLHSIQAYLMNVEDMVRSSSSGGGSKPFSSLGCPLVARHRVTVAIIHTTPASLPHSSCSPSAYRPASPFAVDRYLLMLQQWDGCWMPANAAAVEPAVQATMLLLVWCSRVAPLCYAAQLSNMELTKQQANVMAALKQGNEALKKAQQEVRAHVWWYHTPHSRGWCRPGVRCSSNLVTYVSHPLGFCIWAT